ncbi:hypothetical protein Ctaglu_05290 [Clostridium tagluense]|uniref:Uncharacterized protein n=1 Tax=Clostridium tagluense TaxID=360422 RepID=A0A401UHC9_9CLOT|nr:hypothetical protein Ctaglu_05290 [Clostridium tagluense]
MYLHILQLLTQNKTVYMKSIWNKIFFDYIYIRFRLVIYMNVFYNISNNYIDLNKIRKGISLE